MVSFSFDMTLFFIHSPDTWPEVLSIFPNAELLWLNTGHLVHFEEPAEFIRLVNAFLVI